MSDLNTYLERQLAWARLSREEQARRIADAGRREEARATRERAAESLAAEFGTDVSEWL